MARVSSEDCLEHIPSPFALVHAAVRRARQLQVGSKPLVERPGEKPTVTSLREIAAGMVEQIPLAEMQQIEHSEAGVSEEEEFAQLLESPDMNVQLDVEEEAREKAAAKKRAAERTDDEDEDLAEELDVDEDEEEEEEA